MSCLQLPELSADTRSLGQNISEKKTLKSYQSLILAMGVLKIDLFLNFPVWRTYSFIFSLSQSSLVSFICSSKTLKPFGMWNPDHNICPHRKSSVNCHYNEEGENILSSSTITPFPPRTQSQPLPSGLGNTLLAVLASHLQEWPGGEGYGDRQAKHPVPTS